MPKTSFQKKRILILRDLLLERTDEQHPITMNEIQAYLSANGIDADSRSIIDDIRVLQETGLDIICGKDYRVASREFELPELKILCEYVRASKFITEKKSKQLIKKLEKLCSKHEVNQIRGQAYQNQFKSENEDIYRTIDTIQRAILDDKLISFQYQEYTATKQLTFQKNNKSCKISPISLVYSGENYYLLGDDYYYDETLDYDECSMRYYRIDRMKNVKAEEISRIFWELSDINELTTDYLKQDFSIYGGSISNITIQFPNHIADIAIDYFGKKTPIITAREGYFQITVNVEINTKFFGRIFGLGKEVKIIEPQSVAQLMKDLLNDTYQNYIIPRNRKKKPKTS